MRPLRHNLPNISRCRHLGRNVAMCSGSLQRPQRPASRPPPVGPRQQGGGGYGLKQAADELQKLWHTIHTVFVAKDSSSGLCLKPSQPGKLGKRVRLLTNHLNVTLMNGAIPSRVYTVSITLQQSPAAPTAGSSGSPTAASGPAVTSIPLDVKQQVLPQLASEQSWRADAWQYDAASNRLFSLDPLPDSVTHTVVGPSAAVYQVTLQESSSTIPSPALSAADPNTLDLLGMLLKASLRAALPKGAAQTPRSFLLRPTSSPVTSGSGNRGGRGGGGRGAAASSTGTGGGLQFWEGIRSGVKVCDGDLEQSSQARLNIQLDTTAGGVVPAGPLSQLVLVDGAASPADLVKHKRLCRQAEERVKGVKIQVSHYPTGPQSRKVLALDRRSPHEFKFKWNERSATVAEYFQSEYPHLQLHHLSDWPCVMVSKTAAIPLELCSVAEPQARSAMTDRQTTELIRLAALRPEQRLKNLQNIIAAHLMNFQLPLMQTWGVHVTPQLLEVPGRVLPDAKLQYSSSCCVDAANAGQWRAERQLTFLQPACLQQWAVLNLAGQQCAGGVREFVAQLRRQLQQQSGTSADPQVINGTTTTIQAAVREAAEAAATGRQSVAHVQLLLVVLPDMKGDTYNQVKRAAADMGIPTQCVVAAKAGINPGPAAGGSSQIKAPYVANVLLKVNKKAGGINWQLPLGPESWAAKLGSKQLMVFGIDVGHGMAGGAGKKPSTAAVVGSLDRGCSRYGAVVLEQTAGEEIVLGLREAVQQLLRDRCKTLQVAGQPAAAEAGHILPIGGLPDSLLVYRDGVSDSQYVAVLQEEVAAIRHACSDVGGQQYRPKIIFLIVSKSHGTRLLPHPEDRRSNDGRSGNVVPGTVVDTNITAPLKFEFFLNSHAGIQGTNRPARYNVLVDDAGLGPDGLQLVTQHLASTYCACTRTISCPAPVRYADKAARIAAAAAGQAGGWQVVQAAAPGMKAREYRVLDMSSTMAGKMWFV